MALSSAWLRRVATITTVPVNYRGLSSVIASSSTTSSASSSIDSEQWMIAPHRLPLQNFASRLTIVDHLVDTVHANRSPWYHPSSTSASSSSSSSWSTAATASVAPSSVLPFAGWRILCIQHQLGTHLSQTEALVRLGAQPQHLYFLPPAYTQSRPIFDTTMQHVLGIPAANFYHHQYSLRHRYEQYRKQQVLDALVSLVDRFTATPVPSSSSLPAPILILDDGGHFIEGLYSLSLSTNTLHASARDFWLSSGMRLAAVEQTARGVFKLQDEPHLARLANTLNMPIVSVAESKAKKTQEPRYIAQALISGINHVFTRPIGDPLRAQPPNCRPKVDRVLVLGYGAIGAALARQVTGVGVNEVTHSDHIEHTEGRPCFKWHPSQVHVWDRDPLRCAAAKADGFVVLDNNKQWNGSHHQYDYVIGCSGRQSLQYDDLHLLASDATLISASSGAIEFPFYDYVARATHVTGTNGDAHVLDSNDIHQNVVFTLPVDGSKAESKRVTCVNGGMPVTFLGLLNPITPDKISGTIASMLAAAIQAVRHTPTTPATTKITATVTNNEISSSGIDAMTGMVAMTEAPSRWIEDQFHSIEQQRRWH